MFRYGHRTSSLHNAGTEANMATKLGRFKMPGPGIPVCMMRQTPGKVGQRLEDSLPARQPVLAPNTINLVRK